MNFAKNLYSNIKENPGQIAVIAVGAVLINEYVVKWGWKKVVKAAENVLEDRKNKKKEEKKEEKKD